MGCGRIRGRARAMAAVVAVCGVAAWLPPEPAGAAGATGAAPAEQRASRARFLMGTRLVIEAEGQAPAAAIESAFDEVTRLEAILSNWRADSEVARVNRAGAVAPVPVSTEFCSATEAALRWAEATGGAFDPTVEPVVARLGLRGPEGRLPGVAAPADTAGLRAGPVGWRGVRFNAARRTVALASPGMGLDFGGIGKGIALDAAARVLRAGGVEAASLDFGGQVLVFGRGPDAGGWRIGIADPADRDGAAMAVTIDAGSLSTSGNAERSGGDGRGAPGHIIDPGSGTPVAWSGSVTVHAGDATAADALSTALFVMGPERGVEWARDRGVEVLYLEPGADGRLVRHAAGALFNGSPGEAGPRAGSEAGGRAVAGPAAPFTEGRR